uniref:Putative mating type 1-2 protein n=2 Tax=Cercospora zeina TaxID=348901 RepID=A0ENG1_9PEZI|nr:putative mating type 1-2 protein [Cercospora zeina]
MATQITDTPQPQVVSVEALQQIFSICDDVTEDLRNGAQIPVVPVTNVFQHGDQVVELLKGRLQATTGTRFELQGDVFGGTSLFPIAAPMSFESPANSADQVGGLMVDEGAVSAGTPSTNKAASTRTKKSGEKTPRPKNAFMIYRLDLHATVAAQNPGMHNNDISKIIGAKWRSEKPHVVEEYKNRAEEEKRQHAIDHPGYRYQPRKPSEKKKRMTKGKLAKLAAKSGSTNATMDVTNLPGQLDANDQLYSMLVGEQLNFGTNTSSYETTAPQLVTFGGAELDISAFSEPWASLNIQYQQQQADAGMVAQHDPTSVTAGFTLPSNMVQTASPTATRQPYTEQQRHAQLDNTFTLENLINADMCSSFPLGDEFAGIPDNFNAADNAVLLSSEI